MTIQRTFTHHAAPVEIRLPRLFVVAFLADANGDAVTEATKANAAYIRTEMYDCEDAAFARWDVLTAFAALFVSCQDDSGESIV